LPDDPVGRRRIRVLIISGSILKRVIIRWVRTRIGIRVEGKRGRRRMVGVGRIGGERMEMGRVRGKRLGRIIRYIGVKGFPMSLIHL